MKPSSEPSSDDDFEQGADYTSLGRPGETFWSKYVVSVFGTLGSLAVAGIAFQAGYDPYGHFPTLAKLVIGLAGLSALAFAFLGGRKFVAESTLGGVDVTWEPHDLQTGQDLTVTVRFEPESAGTLNGCDLTLEAYYYKKIRDPDGADHRTRVDVCERTKRIPESYERSFTDGELVELSTDLAVPAYDQLDGDGPYNWDLEVHLDIAAFPDWMDTFEINQ